MMSSVNHDDFARLKIPLENIRSATNNFDDKNIIGGTEFGNYYKGYLSWSGEFINISARRLNKERFNGEEEFWLEISMLSSLKHKNLVSLVGFCDENDEKIIIIRRETIGSLENYLSDSMRLTWVRRLEICLGLANALSYIHYDEPRDFSVILRNISSGTVLLDYEWKPRLFESEDVTKTEASKSVNHKSVMYSFGILLFELLCGRRSIIDDQDNKYLASVAIIHYREKTLYNIIDPVLWKQMDPRSFNIFEELAYDCLNEERSQRPNIDEVVIRLEKAVRLQLERENVGSLSQLRKSHFDRSFTSQVVKRFDIASRVHQSIYENPELPMNAVDGTSSSYNHLRWKNLEHLKIALNDIKLATENFADKYRIGKGGYATIYKAQLEHFDSSNSSSIEGKNKCDLPKKRSTVAIKRLITNNGYGEQGFIAEIEILTSCKHQNIISLLGFCDEDRDHPILVYELASKGSLADYMGNSDKMTNLTWVQRLKICLDIAHGMNYIHTNTDHGKQKIIHRDIKSANILLGDNWDVKISDFGFSFIIPADQEADTLYIYNTAGTHAYWDPEYEMCGRLSTNSDIYSFGVVLLEVLTGRLAHDRIFTDVNEMGIAPIARDYFEKGTLMEIVDPKIKEETDGHVFSLSKGPNKVGLDIFLELAVRCVAETQAQRPTIQVVINELKKALYSQAKVYDVAGDEYRTSVLESIKEWIQVMVLMIN